MALLRKTYLFAATITFTSLAITGCGGGEESSNTGSSGSASATTPSGPQREQNLPKVVYTTFYPTTYMANYIGGGEIEVVCPLPPDTDPIFWRPTPEQIGEYQQAGLIIINGAEYEKWVPTAALPPSRMVDTAAPLAEDFITMESTTHSHGSAGEHTHEGVDGHTWVDPMNAIAQAEQIKIAFEQVWPDLADVFNDNFEQLKVNFESIHGQLAAGADRMKEAQVLCNHPAYNYLAARHEWEVTNLDLNPEAELTEEQISELRTVVDPDRKTLLLWESKPLESIEQILSDELDIISVVFSPGETQPGEDDTTTTIGAPGPGGGGARQARADYYAILGRNIRNINAALRK